MDNRGLVIHLRCMARETTSIMGTSKIRELEAENHRLRNLLVSLSATLLRNIASESETRQLLGTPDAARLIREAEECFRCARIPGLHSAIAEGLEAAGRELMAMAVVIETDLQRGKRKD